MLRITKMPAMRASPRPFDLVVVGNGGRNAPVGMLTDRDVAIGVVALGVDAETTLVEAVMRPGLAAVSESTAVRDAIKIMRDQGVRRLPVVDDAQRVIGLLSADDLLDLLAGEISDLAAMVSRGIGREQRERAPYRPREDDASVEGAVGIARETS